MGWIDRLPLGIQRRLRFEYWPYLFFYAPLYPYGIFLALRARSFSYFTACNPNIRNSGAFESSKYNVVKHIVPPFALKGVLLTENEIAEALQLMAQEGLTFPLVAKPDVGERGTGVEIIHTADELRQYLSSATELTILQEYTDLPLELGIFYHRYPWKDKGEITSIVMKDFLKVVGNGRSTLRDLILDHIRAQKRLDYLLAKFASQLDRVLAVGEELLLEPIGNHARGTTFLNGNHLINDELVAVFDKISSTIPDFYYGRFDIKTSSLPDLYAGHNIQVLEVNGVSSEPAHIYDPSTTIFEAYRALAQHFTIIYRISVANHKAGFPYTPLGRVLKDLRNHYSR
ncbi:MAG: hypothetical protein SFW35_01885 [Chitinophagales bacterium]|nr:hypothetical protein [Chitinophagales bacterium]